MTTTEKAEKCQVATTILSQIGKHALTMIGAKNMGATENSVSMKIGRNSKRITHLKITLTSMDLYHMEFMYLSTKTMKVVSEEDGVYDDMLCAIIENHTGLFTSL